MYLRLAFSIAVHSPADIFLFDEVLAVGDEDFQSKCHERLADIRSNNGTIVVVSHDIATLHRISDKMVSLQHGAVVDGEAA